MSTNDLIAVAAPRHKVRKTSSDTRHILTTENPEIFKAIPRPGGYVCAVRSEDMMPESCMCHEDEVEVVYAKRSHTSVSSSKPTASSARTTRSTFNTGDDSDLEMTNIQLDSLNMLAVTISCVMLMASESKVPEQHMKWAENYLKCIKTDDGNHPPNIQGILNHIRYLREPGGNKSRESVRSSGSRSKSREKVDEKDEKAPSLGKKPSSSSAKQKNSGGKIPRRAK